MSKKGQLGKTKTPVNCYGNIIYISYESITTEHWDSEKDVQQDTLIQLEQMPIKLHAAALAQLMTRHPRLKEILALAVVMSDDQVKEQN